MQHSIWGSLAVLMICHGLMAGNAWKKSPAIREYIKAHYPHVEQAICDGSFEQLQKFDHHLVVGQTITKRYADGTSFASGVLVGARWGEDPAKPRAYDFSFTDMALVDFSFANLSKSLLFNATAINADFDFAKLNCHTIRGADFSGSSFYAANIMVNGVSMDASLELLSACGAITDKMTNINGFKSSPGAHASGSGIQIVDTDKKLADFHWFPMLEVRPGGEPRNNLYAKDGALDKLDRVTAGQARKYEYEHFRQPFDAGHEFAWFGHCSQSAAASILLDEPRHAVKCNAKDGTPVTFTPHDIKGLLVKMGW